MKAVFFSAHGGQRRADRSATDPTRPPGPGEVLVRVRAAAMNRLDLFVRDGIPGVPSRFRTCRGADGAGVVEALGAGVTGPRARHARRAPARSLVRDVRVLPRRRARASACRIASSASTCPGTFARSSSPCRPRTSTRRRPPLPEQAAAFPLAALTAWRLLVTRAALRPGETVLIHGVGGGVSTFALQIAKLCGASRVIVTSSSAEKRARALEMGADDAIDSKEDVGKARPRAHEEARRGRRRRLGRRRDLEALARRLRRRAAGSSRRGATSGPNPEEEIRHIFWKQLSILGSTMGTDAEFTALLAAVSAGRIVPVVDSVVPLAEGRKAYERMQSAAGTRQDRRQGDRVSAPDPDVSMLRHALATLAYRAGKAVRGAPEGFGDFRAGEGGRTPVADPRAHGRSLRLGAHDGRRATRSGTTRRRFRGTREVARFFAALERFDAASRDRGAAREPRRRRSSGARSPTLSRTRARSRCCAASRARSPRRELLPGRHRDGRVGRDQAPPKPRVRLTDGGRLAACGSRDAGIE